MAEYNLLVTAAGELDHTAGYNSQHIAYGNICPCNVAFSFKPKSGKTVIVFPGNNDFRNKYNSQEIYEVNASHLTSGALISALFGLEVLNLGLPLVIANGNSIINEKIGEKVDSFLLSDAAASILAFHGTRDCWSYIEVDDENEALQFHEKKVVGSLASTGIAMFKTAQLFLDCAKWALINNAQENGQFYVSAALNFLIADNQRLSIVEIPSDHYEHKLYGKGS